MKMKIFKNSQKILFSIVIKSMNNIITIMYLYFSLTVNPLIQVNVLLKLHKLIEDHQVMLDIAKIITITKITITT